MALPFPNLPRFSADAFSVNVQGLNPLQRVLSSTTVGGTVTYSPYDPPVIKAPLKSVADAVESAYILTAKADLPKVSERDKFIDVDGFGAVALTTDRSGYARNQATAWLAAAQYLEVQENARASEEAKAKAVADAAAAAAKQARLDELADEWFGKDFAGLGPNKAAAIKEIHRLETRLNTKDAA